MPTLVEDMITVTGRLEAAPGTPAEELASLRAAVVAAFIQENPGVQNVPPDPSLDPAIAEAIRAGAELVAELEGAGKRLRVVRQDFLPGTTRANRGEAAATTFGPFVEPGGGLARFDAFEAGGFILLQLLTLPF